MNGAKTYFAVIRLTHDDGPGKAVTGFSLALHFSTQYLFQFTNLGDHVTLTPGMLGHRLRAPTTRLAYRLKCMILRRSYKSLRPRSLASTPESARAPKRIL